MGPTAAQRIAAAAAVARGFATSPFVGVEWSPAYIAFLVFMFVTITFRLPLGTGAMSIALLTLPLERDGVRIPMVVGLGVALLGWSLLGMTTTEFPAEVLAAIGDFAKVIAVLFVAVNVLTTRSRLRAFLVLTCILWFFFPIRGTLISYAVGGTLEGRAIWNFVYSNPNDLAALCLLQLSVALGVLAVEHKWWVKLGTQIVAALLVLIIVLTQSRGAMIALIVFVLIFGKAYLRYVTVPRAIAGLALVALVGYVAPDSVWRRFSSIRSATNTDMAQFDPETNDLATRQDQSSSVQRLAIWDVAEAMTAENPILGVGFGAYPNMHQRMAMQARFNPIARGRRDTHSTYLNLSSEIGLVGLAIFISAIVSVLRTSRRVRRLAKDRMPALAAQAFNFELGLYGYLVAAIWGSYGAATQTYMHLGLIYAAGRLLEQEAGVGEFGGVVRRKIPFAQTRARAAQQAGARS
jgi:O-antigen ligase